MINYKKYKLNNGLIVLVNESPDSQLACFSLLYKVGSRNEQPNKTGFAHLFEHLMFEGSKNIPHFDEAMESAGGENNAFTNSDYTNYYCNLPAQNIETAFWLESDRMRALDFSEEKLSIQKNVVSEEFKEYYITQPYGDVWHQLLPLAYATHPYQWPVIGKNLEHIANFELQDVKDFFYQYYRPNNAILSISGGVNADEMFNLAIKWFGDIDRGTIVGHAITTEPKQTANRFLELTADVPLSALYKAWPICNRMDQRYYAFDLLSDLLALGQSSRLFHSLVKEQKIFHSIEAYLSGSLDEGLFIIEGKLNKNQTFEQAEHALSKVLDEACETELSNNELNKLKNKVFTTQKMEECRIQDKAMNMAYYEMIDSVDLLNLEMNKYNQLSATDIKRSASILFKQSFNNTIHYHANA